MNTTKRGRKLVSLAAIAVITLAFTLVPAVRSTHAAEPAENVIFSGKGFTRDGLFEVGFWIWCQPESNSPIYAGACRGSVHVQGQGPASGVAGFIVENPDGTYVARVFSTNANNGNKFLVAAVFHNANPEPESGPNNLVQFGILGTDGIVRTGLAPDSVVNVTGPGD